MKQTVAYKDELCIDGRAYAPGTAHNAFHVGIDPNGRLDDDKQQNPNACITRAGHDRRLMADNKAQWNFSELRKCWPVKGEPNLG